MSRSRSLEYARTCQCGSFRDKTNLEAMPQDAGAQVASKHFDKCAAWVSVTVCVSLADGSAAGEDMAGHRLGLHVYAAVPS